MNILKKHWYDIGGVLSVVIIIFLFFNYSSITNYQLIMWISLISLFYHQLEEYRIVGTFPGMVNKVLFKSEMPDRYPLNYNTAFYVNVVVGWFSYFLAAIFAEKAIWLGIATILISVGNTIAHSIMFNIKGKTYYNAGMITSILFFAPISYYFFKTIHTENLVTGLDYIIGIPIGIALNVIGILKLIDWLKDKNTKYVFDKKVLLKEDR